MQGEGQEGAADAGDAEDEVFVNQLDGFDAGIEYQELVIAHLILKLITDPTVENFYLSANDAKFGQFDDIVIKVKRVGYQNTENYAINVKLCSNSKSATRWLTELCSRRGSWSLHNFISTYYSLVENNIEDYKFILFTNIDFPLDGPIPEGYGFQGIIVGCQVNSLFETNASNKCHKIEMQNCTDVDVTDLSTFHTFFNSLFYIYSNQNSLFQFQTEISQRMTEIVPTTDDTRVLVFLNFIKNFISRGRKKVKLDKKTMQEAFTLNYLSSFIHPIMFAARCEAKFFQEVIPKFDCIVFDQKLCTYVQRIWSGCKIKINKDLKRKLEHHIKKAETDLEKSKLFWLAGETPLIVDGNEITYRVIEIFHCQNFVLLENNPKHICQKLPSHWLCLEVLSDLLEIHSSLYEKVINEVYFKIAGKSFKLREIIDVDKSLPEVVTTSDLLIMGTNQCEIKDNEEILPPFYIQRCLKTCAIQSTFFENLSSETFVLISNVNDKAPILNSLRSSKNQVYKEDFTFIERNVCITRQNVSRENFLEIVNKGKKFLRYHHLRLSDDGQTMQFCESKGDINDLRKYVTDGPLISEEEFCEKVHSQNVLNIICDQPGTGKTLLLKNLKNSVLDNERFTVFVTPSDISELCDKELFSFSSFQEFLIATKYKERSDFEKSVIRNLLADSKTVYFWDILNDIHIHQLRALLDLINYLKNNSHFIACRNRLKQVLESEFRVLSNTLDDLDFFNKLNNENQHLKQRLNFNVENLFQLFTLIKGDDMISVPLHISIIAEFFENKENRTKLLKNQLPVTDIYDYIFEQKLKMVNKNYKNLSLKKKVALKLQKLAILALFDQKILQKLKINEKDTIKDSSEIEQFDIATFNGRHYVFYQTSFAEYFAACYFFEKFKDLDLGDILFEAKYANVRFFFDVLLAQNAAPHLSLLHRDFAKLMSYRNLHTFRDMGGRNVLHLISSLSENYPILPIKKNGKNFVIDDQNLGDINNIKPEYFKILRYLLENFKEIEEVDSIYKMSARQYAEKSGCLLTLAEFDRHQKRKVYDTKNDEFSLSLNILYYCVRLGYYELLKELEVDSIANIKCMSILGLSLINLAAQHGHLHVVKLLSNRYPIDDGTTLYVAAQEGHLEIVKWLIQQNVKIRAIKNGLTALHVACQNGHTEVVDYLLDKEVITENQITPLHLASETGHRDIVELLAKKRNNVNCERSDGRTPLHLASHEGHFEIVKLLLEYEAKVDACDEEDITSLHLASQENHQEIVELLLDCGADIDACMKDGKTALHLASQNGHCDVVKLLLQRKAQMLATYPDKITALHLASKEGHYEVVELLIHDKGYSELTLQNGETPLHLASEGNYWKIAQLLLSNNAKVDASALDGKTPLHVACKNGHKETAELLIKQKANVNAALNDGTTPVYLSIQYGYYEIAFLLLKSKADILSPDDDGTTLLHRASQKEHHQVVKFLLKHDANVNASDKNGITPLHMSSLRGDLEIVNLLLKFHAEVNAISNGGITPLHEASKTGHLKIVQILLNNGADVNAVADNGMTPLKVASKRDHSDVVKLLTDNGAYSTEDSMRC